ncbi:MAG: DinB family protein [Terriglobales bacterium]
MILIEVPRRLEEIPDAKAGLCAPSEWSPKQELGHLLDSAANNHQQIVRAQLEDQPALPGYDGERWVELHDYQGRDWNELISLWKALNTQLLAAARAVPDSAWSRTCTIADSKPWSSFWVEQGFSPAIGTFK